MTTTTPHKHYVVPAHAGVDRKSARPVHEVERCPRARGGGPPGRMRFFSRRWLSPRTRGWTVMASVYEIPLTVVPAHAGVDRNLAAERCQAEVVPAHAGVDRLAHASPETSEPVVPAHAGVDRH